MALDSLLVALKALIVTLKALLMALKSFLLAFQLVIFPQVLILYLTLHTAWNLGTFHTAQWPDKTSATPYLG